VRDEVFGAIMRCGPHGRLAWALAAMKNLSKTDTFRKLVESELGEYLAVHLMRLADSDFHEARNLTALFYRNSECSLAIYDDPRNGEVNVQIGPKDAPLHGFDALRSDVWSYLPTLVPDVPAKTLEELCRDAPQDHSYQGQLLRIRQLLVHKLSPAIIALTAAGGVS